MISLTPDQAALLASMGVTATQDGLRDSAGARVRDGVAVTMLSKSIQPGDFQRGPLTEGHAAASAGQWTHGIPERPTPVGVLPPSARTGPAGDVPAGSGTADAGTGADVAKTGNGLMPSLFQRSYLAAGHQADSPGTTGRYGVTPQPGSMGVRPGGEPHVAEPLSFTRPALHGEHEADPPGNDPQGNSPHAGGTPASAVYRTAADRYEANRAQDRSDHVMPSQMMRTGSEPAPARVAMPADMRAGSVPADRAVAATRPAPGEGR